MTRCGGGGSDSVTDTPSNPFMRCPTRSVRRLSSGHPTSPMKTKPQSKRRVKPIGDTGSTKHTQRWLAVPSLHSTYPETAPPPTLQYFVATLCDLEVSPEHRMRLGLRYANTPQVQRLLGRVRRERYAACLLATVDANAIVTTLKEILSSFPGGIFNKSADDFVCVSLQCSLRATLAYVNGLVDGLPYFVRQFTYLICRSLKNLISQSKGTAVDVYTDALLLFTPALFPNAVDDAPTFVRATRICLVLIDLCDLVFRPSPPDDDDRFFSGIVCSLSRLHQWLGSQDDRDTRSGCEGGEVLEARQSFAERFPANTDYYQITYLFD